jgi:acrylyl-CoA reductase (NADPH)
MAPKPVRLEAWRRIGADLDLKKLSTLSRSIGFNGIVGAARDIVDGRIRGRVVVDM